MPQRNRDAFDARAATAPVSTPLIRLPMAQMASSGPAMAVEPASSENATVATSAPPSSAPMAKAETIRGTSIRHGIRGWPSWWTAPVDRRLGPLLADQEDRARDRRDHGEAEARQRVHDGGQPGHQGRTDDEHTLVDDRLERVRRVQRALVLARGATTAPGSTTRSAAGSPRRRPRRGGATAPAGRARRRPSSPAARRRTRARRSRAPDADPAGRSAAPAVRRTPRWRRGRTRTPRRPARTSRCASETSRTIPRLTMDIGIRATRPLTVKASAPGSRSTRP